MTDWAEQQHADECARLQAIVEALKVIQKAGAPQSEINLLAVECGVWNEYQRERN